MSTLVKHFRQLDQLLLRNQPFWKPRAFINKKLAWENTHPQILQCIETLSLDNILTIDSDFQKLIELFATAVPDTQQLWKACQLPKTQATPKQLTAFDKVDIPGRKWEQITAFASSLNMIEQPIVDWCSGKGHLARIVHRYTGQTVHCLEIDPTLCQQGKQLANKKNQPLCFYQQDVLEPLPSHLDNSDHNHIALHACGQLHISLLTQASAAPAKQLALSPCCYHKISDPSYRPLSQTAIESSLSLSRDDLKLAMEETVTAGNRVQEQRQQELIWRLGFDELQRWLTGKNQYRPLPSIKKSLLNKGFKHFVQWACDYQQLTLAEEMDLSEFLQQGKTRYIDVLRKDLLRHLFRRPLEMWLVLDRALYLEEQGYRVNLSEFCERAVTPRNILINAQR